MDETYLSWFLMSSLIHAQSEKIKSMHTSCVNIPCVIIGFEFNSLNKLIGYFVD